MILEIGHQHAQEDPPQRKRCPPHGFDAQAQNRRLFAQMLAKSETRLYESSTSAINKLRQLSENRVYTTLDISPLQYLFILFEDRRQHLGSEAQTMDDIMKKQHKRVMSDLLKQKISIGHKQKSILTLKKELEHSIDAMRLLSPEVDRRSSGEKAKAHHEQMTLIKEDFAKQGHAADDERSRQAKQFLRNLRQRQMQQRSRYRMLLKKEREQKQQANEKSRINKEQEHSRLKQELHKELIKRQQQKLQKDEVEKQKREQVQLFLQKFKTKPPNYILFSERYKQKEAEEERERKQYLQLLKQSKRHSSLSELKDQMRKHEEIKAAHRAERREQEQMDEGLREEIRSRLGRLYKSRVFSKSISQQVSVGEKQRRQKSIIKQQMYSQQVASLHAPKISEEKREELQRSIQELSTRENHSLIKKRKSGENVLIDRNELDPRKVGLEYLQQVKKITSLVERKPPPTPEKPSLGKLQKFSGKRSFYNKKITISNWKEIMGNTNYTPEQKQQKIKVYFDLIEEIRLKQLEEAKKADQQRWISIQQIMDHYQLEKAQAKLSLLKSFK